MAEVWTWVPEFGYTATDELPAVQFRYAGTGTEQNAALQSLARRRYVVTFRGTNATRAAINAFLLAANYTVTSFLFLDPKDYARTAVSLGTSIASQVTFSLPTTGEESRYYPVNDANVVVYDDGSPITVSSASPTARTITVSSAPTSGSVMTADFYAYRMVRLQEPPAIRLLSPDYFEVSCEFREVPS